MNHEDTPSSQVVITVQYNVYRNKLVPIKLDAYMETLMRNPQRFNNNYQALWESVLEVAGEITAKSPDIKWPNRAQEMPSLKDTASQLYRATDKQQNPSNAAYLKGYADGIRFALEQLNSN